MPALDEVVSTSAELPSKYTKPLREVLRPLWDHDDADPLLSQRYLAELLQRPDDGLRREFLDALREAATDENATILRFMMWMIEHPVPTVDAAEVARWLSATADAEEESVLGPMLQDAQTSFLEGVDLADEDGLPAPWDRDIRLFVSDPEDAYGAVLLLQLANLAAPHLDDVHFDGPDPFAEDFPVLDGIDGESMTRPPDSPPAEGFFDAFAAGVRHRIPARTYPGAIVDIPAAVELTNALLLHRGVDIRMLLLAGSTNDLRIAIGPTAALNEATSAGILVPQTDYAASMRALIEQKSARFQQWQKRVALVLKTGFSEDTPQPTLEDVFAALEGSVTEPDNPFVILCKGERFVQGYCVGGGRFILEYCEDPLQHPRFSAGDDNSLGQAIRLFQEFHAGGELDDVLPWVEVEGSAPGDLDAPVDLPAELKRALGALLADPERAFVFIETGDPTKVVQVWRQDGLLVKCRLGELSSDDRARVEAAFASRPGGSVARAEHGGDVAEVAVGANVDTATAYALEIAQNVFLATAESVSVVER